MISRRTIILFLLAAALWGVVYYLSWDFEWPCREWRQFHAVVTSNDKPAQQPDGSVSFSPCDLWYALPPRIMVSVFSAFSCAVAFL